MKTTAMPKSIFMGWDVGAWNCDKDSKSRDAIVILDSSLDLVGQPWRGNLRKCIGTAITTREWLAAIFDYCKVEFSGPTVPVLHDRQGVHTVVESEILVREAQS